jgi:hypothetical protein
VTAAPEVYGEIVVVAGEITSRGLVPATTPTRRISATPTQFLRLTERLGSLEAFRALMLAIEHGDLRLDPLRIEIGGWKREWLMEHGMPESQARRAVSALKRSGFIEKVYGERGAAGGSVAVVNGSHFAWPEAVTQVVSPSGRPRLVIATESVDNAENTQVSTFGQESPERKTGPVDNPVGTFGHKVPEREMTQGRLGNLHPDDLAPKCQVTAIGHLAPEREPTPPTSKEVVQEDSLLDPRTGVVAPLTRSNLHQFLGEPRLREALADREVHAITTLSGLFAHNLESTVAALEFFDRPSGASPEVDLAWFVYDLITVSAAGRADAAEAVVRLLRAKGARVPTMKNEAVLRAVVLLLAAAQDKAPRTWPGYVVWAIGHQDWKTSGAVKRLVEALNQVVYSERQALVSPEVPGDDQAEVAGEAAFPAADPPVTVASPPSSPVAPPTEVRLGLPHRAPQRTPGPRTPSEEEQDARGDGYWDWLREEVLPGTEFDDPQTAAMVMRNRNMQDRLIASHRRRTTGEGL